MTAMTRKWIKPRKIEIHDRQTSVRLEPQFWFYLRQIASEQGSTAKALIEAVEKARNPNRSLSSALRVYLTGYLYDHPLP
jgi:predicted DNA-binding ribbon-helix-helix protein